MIIVLEKLRVRSKVTNFSEKARAECAPPSFPFPKTQRYASEKYFKRIVDVGQVLVRVRVYIAVLLI